MKTLETDIQIDAPPEVVWSILTDLDSYPKWNPFITKASGSVKVGETLEISISSPGSKPVSFKPRVKSAAKDTTFSWLGHFLFPGIFDGEHVFKIVANERGCLFIQKENFGGILVPLAWRGIESSTRAGFVSMNNALKQRAEHFAAQQTNEQH